MYLFTKILLPILLLLAFLNLVNANSDKQEFYLEQGEMMTHNRSFGFGNDNLEIYCYEGKPKYIIHLWQSVSLEVDLATDYVYYEGATPEIVRKQYLERRSSWGINLFSWKQKSFKLDPFNQSCIGIDSEKEYHVYLHVIRVDYWRVLCLLLGLVLFFSANKLSNNVMFYYLCGVSFGISASFLILIYFLSKLFPKRPMMYGVVIGGWTVGVYILQLLWENMRTILVNYQNFVIWYAFIVGTVSFVVCYRWGPVTNERTKNLIRWSLQGLGLIAVFHSSQFQEAAMGQIVIIILVHNFPKKWLSKSKTYWKRRFPPKVHLLSNTEYYQQGVVETAKALENLRNYCSSPNCNQWKTALKLKDVKSPNTQNQQMFQMRNRFASFVEGTSHLSDNEILEYESSIQTTDLTDDEDEILTDEEM